MYAQRICVWRVPVRACAVHAHKNAIVNVKTFNCLYMIVCVHIRMCVRMRVCLYVHACMCMHRVRAHRKKIDVHIPLPVCACACARRRVRVFAVHVRTCMRVHAQCKV